MRAIRILLFVIGFGLASWVTLHQIESALDRAGIEPLVTRQEVAVYYRDKVDYLAPRLLVDGAYRVVYLGDSMMVSYPPELVIPAVLQREVSRRGRGKTPVRVLNFGLAGTGVFDYYLMADVITEIAPDMVIIGFNLASHSKRFRAAFARPELAGFLDTERLLESATLPFGWIGLTFDRLLLYRAIVRLGGLDRWIRVTQEQTRVAQAREQLEERLAFRNDRNGTPEKRHEGARAFWSLAENNWKEDPNRYTPGAVRTHFGSVLDGLRPDDASVVMLEATVRSFEERGIRTLVYANPINVDHLERLGMRNADGLARSLSVIEEAVTRNGGLFLDLHDAFPDAAFRDKPGHFVHEGDFIGPSELARRLAPTVMRAARGGPQ